MKLIKIDDKTVEVEYNDLQFGVEFDNGYMFEAEDEDEAQTTAQMTGGKIRVREVFYCTTAWGELEE